MGMRRKREVEYTELRTQDAASDRKTHPTQGFSHYGIVCAQGIEEATLPGNRFLLKHVVALRHNFQEVTS